MCELALPSGLPWTPEEELLLLIDPGKDGPLPGSAVAAFKAIQLLRDAASVVVAVHQSGDVIDDAIAELGEALRAGARLDPSY